MRYFLSSLKNVLFILIGAVIFISSLNSYSQSTSVEQNIDTTQFIRFGKISTKFNKQSFELQKGSIVSNVLKVINHDEKVVSFTVDALFPAGWTRIDDVNKLYQVRPRDTVIVPIIISPTKLINGDTETVINAFVIDRNGLQIGNNFFTLTRKKKVAWGIGLQNNTTYYFKNNENFKDFKFSHFLPSFPIKYAFKSS